MEDLPDLVRSFIEHHIETVLQLEVLVHLATERVEAEPSRLSARLGGSPDAVILALEGLASGRLVERDDELRYRYAPATAELDAQVRATAEAYAKRKVAVVTLIFSTPQGGDDLRSFSDSFKFRRR